MNRSELGSSASPIAESDSVVWARIRTDSNRCPPLIKIVVMKSDVICMSITSNCEKWVEVRITFHQQEWSFTCYKKNLKRLMLTMKSLLKLMEKEELCMWDAHVSRPVQHKLCRRLVLRRRKIYGEASKSQISTDEKACHPISWTHFNSLTQSNESRGPVHRNGNPCRCSISITKHLLN